MARGQPVSQNHMNSPSPWDIFTYSDNKQMSGGDEVSAMEQNQRNMGMIPARIQNNDLRQPTTTTITNAAATTTPINNSPTYLPAGGSYNVPSTDNQFHQQQQQQYHPSVYQLAQSQGLPHRHLNQSQYPQQFPQQQLDQQQRSYNPQAPVALHPYHPQYVSQQSISTVGYPPVSSATGSAGLDPSFFPHHSRNSSAPLTSELTQHPTKPQSHGRRPSNKGPLQDNTGRIHKRPPKSSTSPSSHRVTWRNMKGENARLYHAWLGDNGFFPDGESSPEVDFEEFIDFAIAARNAKVKSEPMSHDPMAMERPNRGVSSIRDEPMTAGFSPNFLQNERKKIAKLYRGYQKEFRPKESQFEHMYRCTMGCHWSHKVKSNWDRHERTHYPQELWICCHERCLNKSAKTRVSFRKDLARRHHTDHHHREGDPLLTDRELEDLKYNVTESLFPRECVFQNCFKQFTTFDERSTHIENHLKNGDILDRQRIEKCYPEDEPQLGSDHDGDHEMDAPGYGNYPGTIEPHNDEGGDDEKDEDDDDNDGGAGGIITKYHPDDRDDGTGAGGAGGNVWNPYGGAAGSGSNTNTNHQQQQYSPMSTHPQGYMHACDFDTFGGSGHIPAIDKRPWKRTTSLRLQLLPQVFARGIAQTPIVLKKIQLQAALMLDLSSVKKTQIINILRREIAMMAGALPVSSGPSIKRFPHLTAMTKLLPSLTKTASRIDMSRIAKQNQAILKFAGFRKDLLSEELEDPGGEDDDDEFTDPLRDRLTHFEGGHIYRCLPIHSSMTRIRPSRLVHVGTKNKPILHLDTSEALPSHVNYCSLSHCWDDGYGLCLSKENVTSFKHSIPADGLTQTFHVAINIARERGLEYLWIDTLCIMQDSDEDIQAEVPRITQIHASATFAIVITSVAYDGDAQQFDESASEENVDFDEKSEEQSIPETPELTIGDTVETELHTSDKTTRKDTSTVEIIRQLPERRDSHQLESFLAEGSKRSFFSPLSPWDKISLTQSSSSVPSHSRFDLDEQINDLNGTLPNKQPSRVVHYLDKWRFRWQKLSNQPEPSSSAASVVTTSPVPSISDRSVHSEKKKHPVFVLPVSFEKLFRGFRSKHTRGAELDDGSGHSDG